jgi:hypothetical protein
MLHVDCISWVRWEEVRGRGGRRTNNSPDIGGENVDF